MHANFVSLQGISTQQQRSSAEAAELNLLSRNVHLKSSLCFKLRGFFIILLFFLYKFSQKA